MSGLADQSCEITFSSCGRSMKNPVHCSALPGGESPGAPCNINTNTYMNKRLSLIVGSAIGLALAASAAHALTLSGSTAGSFQGVSSGYTVVTNTGDGSFASFRTGLPVGVGSFKSGIEFNADSFANISNGDTFALGVITYYNGVTRIGTSSADALFDFRINLDSPEPTSILLTTVKFGIDATVNTPENTNPDIFTASFTQPAPVLIGGQWVKFTINELPPSLQVKENSVVEVANVTVTFLNPVPEPATYGLIGALGLMGLAGYRRFRAQRGNAAGASMAVA
jgi:PEP-CTERM motif-containing protein